MMNLAEKLQELAAETPRKLDHAKKEATTRSYLVDPFIEALGFSVNDPEDVEQEFTADIGKQGERVDYAIKLNRNPIIFIEVKPANTTLSNYHASQLRRYYGTKTNVRLSILTNGVEYRFFADLEKPNVMDDEPYMIIDIRLLHDWQIDELRGYTKSELNIDHVLSSASTLKYQRGFISAVEETFDPLSSEVIDLLIRKVYSGNLTKTMLDKLTPLAEQAWQEFLRKQGRASQSIAQETENAPDVPGAKIPDVSDESISHDGVWIPVYAHYEGEYLEAKFQVKRTYKKRNDKAILYDGEVHTLSGLARQLKERIHKEKNINKNPSTAGWTDFWYYEDSFGAKKYLDDFRRDPKLVERYLRNSDQ